MTSLNQSPVPFRVTQRLTDTGSSVSGLPPAGPGPFRVTGTRHLSFIQVQDGTGPGCRVPQAVTVRPGAVGYVTVSLWYSLAVTDGE